MGCIPPAPPARSAFNNRSQRATGHAVTWEWCGEHPTEQGSHMSQPVTVSVDLGYGHVKAVTHAGGTLVRERFPSFASLNTGSGGATSIAEIGRLDVVHVAVGDAHYTVGKDTTLMKAGSVDRNRDTSYSTTDQY